MEINATSIRIGNILVIGDELYRVTWTMHRTPGKGNACMQTKLKNIMNGKNLEKRFLSSERVEKAELQTRQMQYLYEEGEGIVFMDNDSYEQTTLGNDLLEGIKQYLKEGETYSVTYYQESAVGIELPKTLEVKVITAPPAIKKATATAQTKAIELENGMEIQAPVFVKEGDIIRINTETGEYLERA